MRPMEKSDLPVVARKRANKAASAAAEPAERRGGAKENADLQSTVRTQSREAVSQAQARIREAVIRNRQGKLTALLHHINIDVLRASFSDLKKTAAPGVDEVTWTEYAKRLEENLLDLHARVHTGAYRALPSRRKYIPKADGRQRPFGIAAIEDKIVQAAVVAILTPIYESEFLGFSYGFRPKRNQHQALDALAFGIGKRRINWVLDCDVQSFFDKVSRDWLIRFVEHRIGDRQIIQHAKMVVVETPSEGKPSMGKSIRKFAAVTRVGIDLAKRIFQVHAVDAKGEVIEARPLNTSSS